MAKTPNTKGKAKSDKAKPRLLTPVFAISFPKLWVPEKGDSGTDKFGCVSIWTPSKFSAGDKALWSALKAELDRVSVEAFGVPRLKLPRNIHRALRNGNEKEGVAGYGEGTYFANMSSNSPPGVINKDKEEVSPDAGNASEIFPGAMCRARVAVGSYNFKDPKTGATFKGLKIYVSNVQKLKDGPRLDSRVAAEDDFDEDIDAEWLDDTDEESEESGDDDFE